MTNSKDLQEKLTKAEEKLTKKQALLKKYEAKVAKIEKQIVANGWDLEAGKYQLYVDGAERQSEEYNKSYWTFCDLADAKESVKNTVKAIAEQERIVEKWRNATETAKKAEKIRDNEYPEIFKTFRNNVVKAWTAHDMKVKAFYRAQYNSLMEEFGNWDGYTAFIKKYKHSAYEFMNTDEEDFRKANEKSADRLVLNLWNRVKEKTGTPTEFDLHLENGNAWEGIVINGVVKGTEGNAVVESIYAGGYNIQKLHIRTLVK